MRPYLFSAPVPFHILHEAQASSAPCTRTTARCDYTSHNWVELDLQPELDDLALVSQLQKNSKRNIPHRTFLCLHSSHLQLSD